MTKSFHESYDRPVVPLPSDRSVGIVFAAVALIVAYLWRSNEAVLMTALVASVVLAVISFVIPQVLRPLNVAWMKLAHLLSKVINPVIMFVLFVVTIIPFGILMKAWHDPLRRRRGRENKSYWIMRQSSEQSSMSNQF